MSKLFEVNLSFTRQTGLNSYDKVGGVISIEENEDVETELNKHAATLYNWMVKRNPNLLGEGIINIEKKEHVENKIKLEPDIIILKQYSNAEKSNDVETMNKLKDKYNI
jgi:hypothetical protein